MAAWPRSADVQVRADDVDEAVGLAVAALRVGADCDWRRPAGDLTWDCWHTAEHVASDLVAYAGQLAARTRTRYLPFDIHTQPEADPAGLLEVIQAMGAMLAAVVRTTPAQARAWHPWGMTDPEGFAAMGIVETLGLGLDWAPPRSLCARTVARLFPTAPDDRDSWRVLLWATGRVALPDHERLSTWRWHAAPPEGGDLSRPAAPPRA